jgi:hypothetical protein
MTTRMPRRRQRLELPPRAAAAAPARHPRGHPDAQSSEDQSPLRQADVPAQEHRGTPRRLAQREPKESRRLATRFEKLAVNFLAMVKLAMIQRCLRVLDFSDDA